MRYLVLLGIGVAAVAVVGSSAFAAVSSIRAGQKALTAADAIAIRHQDADTGVHAVYAHALMAVDSGGSAADDIVTELREHADRVHNDLTANRQAAAIALPSGSGLPAGLDRLVKQTDAFMADATRLAQLARRQPQAARTELAELGSSFEGVDQGFSTTADDLATAVAATQVDADRRLRQAIVIIISAAGGAIALLTVLGGLVFRVDHRLALAARREAGLHQFATELHAAFEMVDTEPDAYQASAEALALVGRCSELKLADSSRSAMSTVAATPGKAPDCAIRSPWDCVAVRRGQRMVYPDGEALGACRKLRGRESGPVSSICIPVAFMGRALGVLHSTGPAGDSPDHGVIEQLTTIADQTGQRIGTIRAFSRSELRASTDGLTGLLNRRAVEEHIRGAIAQCPGESYAVAMADLDHFKHLNDVYGHDAGDQALRQFATTLQQTIRAQDIAGRYGGEEFVVFFPRATPAEAAQILDRLRADLANTTARGASAPVTASFGTAGSTERSGFLDVLNLADTRLRRAKQLGRDRTVFSDDEGALTDATSVNPDSTAPASAVPAPRERAEPQDSRRRSDEPPLDLAGQ